MSFNIEKAFNFGYKFDCVGGVTNDICMGGMSLNQLSYRGSH